MRSIDPIIIWLAALLIGLLCWQLATRSRDNSEPIATIRADGNQPRVIALTPDSQHIVTGWSDGTVLLSALARETPVARLTLPHAVRAIAADLRAERFAIGCDDGSIYLVDRNLKKLPSDFRLHDGSAAERLPVSPLRYYADHLTGRRLTPSTSLLDDYPVGTNLGGIRGELAIPQLVSRRTLSIECLAFAKADFVVAGTRDGLFHIAHLPSQRILPAFGSPYFMPNPNSARVPAPPRQLAHTKSILLSDGALAIESKASPFEFTVLRWNIADRHSDTAYEYEQDTPLRESMLIAGSRDGSTVVGEQGGVLKLLGEASAPDLFTFPCESSALGLSSDGQYLVSAGGTAVERFSPQSTLTLCDIPGREIVREWTELPFYIDELSLTPDKTKIAAICSDKAVRIWDSGLAVKLRPVPVLRSVNLAKEALSYGEVVRVGSVPSADGSEGLSLQYTADGGETWTSFAQSVDAYLPSHRLPHHGEIGFRLIDEHWATSNVVSVRLQTRYNGLLKWAAIDDPERLQLGVIQAAFGPLGQCISTIDRKGQLVRRSVDSGQVLEKRRLERDGVFAARFNPTGTHLVVTARHLDAFTLLDVAHESAVVEQKVPSDPYHFVTIDEQGGQMAARSIYSKEVAHIWRRTVSPAKFDMAIGGSHPCFFSSSGEYLICHALDRMTAWSVSDKSLVAEARVDSPEHIVKPGGLDRVFVVYGDRIDVHALPSLSCAGTIFIGDTDAEIASVAVAAGGRRVAIGLATGDIIVIDVAPDWSVAKVSRVHAHGEAVNVVALHPSAILLLSASAKEGEIKLWNMDAIMNGRVN